MIIVEGEETVISEGEEPVTFVAGNLVIFPAGMDCRWDVHKAVSNYYRFGD